MRHLLSLKDVSTAEIEEILRIGRELKDKLKHGIREPLYPGHVLGLIFEKQSLRTRVSFETGMVHLGGAAIYLGEDVGFGKREPICDFGRVLGQMIDIVVVRAKSHSSLEQLAQYSTVPVINGLTDYCHPCQALADIFTLRELMGDTRGKKLAWVGDANNVALSLALMCGRLGLRMSVAVPEAYTFSPETLNMFRHEVPNLELEITEDPVKAVTGASVVYTDVWVSMGQEAEKEKRIHDFKPYQVNGELMAHCPDAFFMHCLPARRGLEVTDEVMESAQSVVIQEAGNRLHAQKGVLVWLMRNSCGE